MTVDLSDAQRAIVERIFAFYLPACRVYVFGSRATGKARTTSDLDLAVDAGTPIEAARLEQVRDALSLSDLPMFVDVIDLQVVDPSFAQHITAEKKLLFGA